MKILSIFLLNFAPVKVKRKRTLASWLLLAVYVPMLLLSSLHLHHWDLDEGATCEECVRHHCSGHLSPLSIGRHVCILCQFLTLPMLCAAIAVLIVYSLPCKMVHFVWLCRTSLAHLGGVSLRAPPYVVL